VSALDKAIAIIKEYEGFRAQAYPDPRTGGEPWTIGYGTTWYANGKKVKKGDKVTEAKALKELEHKVTDLHTQLKREIKVPLTDGQWAAMISFAYNLGLTGSLLQIERLNVGRIAEFKAKHMEYVNKGSNVEAGLRRRRTAELKLFDEGGDMKWVNLVRHGIKSAPEYRAYTMDGET
jgi:lysozyme